MYRHVHLAADRQLIQQTSVTFSDSNKTAQAGAPSFTSPVHIFQVL